MFSPLRFIAHTKHWCVSKIFNALRPKQDENHLANEIFFIISLTFVHKVPINNEAAFGLDNSLASDGSA